MGLHVHSPGCRSAQMLYYRSVVVVSCVENLLSCERREETVRAKKIKNLLCFVFWERDTKINDALNPEIKVDLVLI